MKTDDGHGSLLRPVAVVVSSLLTAAAAHASAGGGVPGPAGWVVVLLALVPAGLLARAWARGRSVSSW